MESKWECAYPKRQLTAAEAASSAGVDQSLRAITDDTAGGEREMQTQRTDEYELSNEHWKSKGDGKERVKK